MIGRPDTVVNMLSDRMADFVRIIRKEAGCGLDIRCRNGPEMALANSPAGIGAGADQLHVTVNGVGERTGMSTPAGTAVAVSRPPFMPSWRLRLETLCCPSRHVAMHAGLKTPERAPEPRQRQESQPEPGPSAAAR